MMYTFLALLLTSAHLLAGESTLSPTRQDLESLQKHIREIPSDRKILLIADTQHRRADTRAATVLIAQSLSERFPGEKICLFLETTEKVNSAWEKFKKSDGIESAYNQHFSPIANAVAKNVSGLSVADAGRTFVEPPYFVAHYLKTKVPDVEVFGVDVDYTDRKIFSTLYENMKPSREMSDNQFAKILIAERNQTMALRAQEQMQKGTCSRALLSTGEAHVYEWQEDSKIFPTYTEKAIPGIYDFLTKSELKPFVIEVLVNKARTCPVGSARNRIDECKMEFRKNKDDLVVELPMNFYLGRLNETYAVEKEPPSGRY